MQKRERDYYHRLLNTGRWRAVRRDYLSAHPFCADCRAQGVLTEATEVHHLVPVLRGGSRMAMERMTFDPRNLVGLCGACHRRRHEGMGKGTAKENARRQSERASGFSEKYFGSDPGGCFFDEGEGV